MNERSEAPDRVVLLCRAFVAGASGATAAQLRDALKALRPSSTNAELNADREVLVQALFHDGLLEPDGRRMACSARGAARLRETLGIGEGSRPTWTVLRDGLLLAHALGLPAPDDVQLRRFRSAGGVRAAVLARTRELGLPPYPTAKEAIDAAGWQELAQLLGDDLDAWRRLPLGSGAIVSCVLGHRLGLRRSLTSSQLLGLLAAQAVGARGADVRALRIAVLADWRERAGPAKREAAPDLHEPAAFASAVRAAATDCPVGRFGHGLVFVADLFDAITARHPDTALDLPTFKRRLLSAARHGLLSLVRADLVEAMDPSLVRRSEIRDLHATFHFVRV